MGVKKRLSTISFYSHSEDHLRIKTVHGGIVSLVAIVLAIVLLFSEAHRCLRLRQEQTMHVDESLKTHIHVEFNITFPALPCRAIRVDTGDISGKFETEGGMQHARDGEIHKWQLSSKGERMHQAEYTSSSVIDNPFIALLDRQDIEEILDAVARHEGCNIFGWLEVKRVAGNIHFGIRSEAAIAVNESPETLEALLFHHVEIHGHDADKSEANHLNSSHVIHTLKFGNATYRGQVHPLEGTRRIDRKATGIDKYFLKIVPTTLFPLWSAPLESYQYSVTEYYSAIPQGARALPGVFFLYDFWPMRVEIRMVRLGFLHFFVRSCAVCGGVWALAKAVDGVVDWIVRKALDGLVSSRSL